MAKKPTVTSINDFRDGRGENQVAFWNRFGVTQSGGSRYENGRRIPEATAILIQLYFDHIVTDENWPSLPRKSPNGICNA